MPKAIPRQAWAGPKGACTHTGKTGAGSDSGAGCNVNKWVFSHAAGPAELPVRQIGVPDLRRTGGRLVSFNVTAKELAQMHKIASQLSVSYSTAKYFDVYPSSFGKVK
jgi:hypothetical protein